MKRGVSTKRVDHLVQHGKRDLFHAASFLHQFQFIIHSLAIRNSYLDKVCWMMFLRLPVETCKAEADGSCQVMGGTHYTRISGSLPEATIHLQANIQATNGRSNNNIGLHHGRHQRARQSRLGPQGGAKRRQCWAR
jgi:hypothetical protein